MIKTVIERTPEELTRDEEIGCMIYRAFNRAFGEVYNLVDIIFPDEKQAKAVKDLIGGVLGRTKTECNESIIKYLNNNK